MCCLQQNPLMLVLCKQFIPALGGHHADPPGNLIVGSHINHRFCKQ